MAGLDSGGAIEHDVEHFRPKGEVAAWPTGAIRRERGIDYPFPTGAADARGYYWLAYHPLNYCASCKKCNTPLKSNYFPIAGDRGPRLGEVAALNENETPFLLYPLGNLDEDPEELIFFVGINPAPTRRSGPRKRRAMVTIDFFELDTREELFRERANQLVALANALFVLSGNPSPENQQFAERTIFRLQAPESPHANCVKSAMELYQSDPETARELFIAAGDYLESLS